MMPEFILQWNTSSLISHWGEFKHYILKHLPLVAAVQETRFNDADPYKFTIAGYSLYTHNLNRSPRQGGTALFVSNRLLHREIKVQTDLDCVTVQAQLFQTNISIVSLYLSPSAPFPKNALNSLLDGLTKPVMILGDFNAHHPAWGCTRLDARGKHTEEWMNKHNLVFLNDKSPTHLPNNRRQELSAIDLSFMSSRIVPYFSWNIQGDKLFSDHLPIHLTLNKDSGQNDYNFVSKWNFTRANWEAFRQQIDYENSLSNDITINQFLQNMLEVAERNIPKTIAPKTQTAAGWWTPACNRAVALRRREERAFRRDLSSTVKRNAAIDALNACKETILRSKKEYFENFASTFNRFTPVGKIWAQVRYISVRKPPSRAFPQLHINGRSYTQPKEVVSQFALHYASVSDESQYSTETTTFLRESLAGRECTSNNTENYNLPFTFYELELSLSKCRNTSVGPDSLAYPMFQNLTHTGKELLLKVVNEMWMSGDFLESWRCSTIIPILKPGKPKHLPSSYRPISLTSCASKIVERMINTRLRTFLESKDILTPFQNGFRTQRSTTDSLIQLIDSCHKGFAKKEITVALFLDLKSAFDKVHSDAVLIKLHDVGIRGRLFTFVRNFLTDRSFSVRCGNVQSNTYTQEQGLPQGSVLSPTLFLIMINDMLEKVHEDSFKLRYSFYADDVTIWSSNSNIDKAFAQIQKALNRCLSWCTKWGLQISPPKSKTMVFSRKNRVPDPLKLLSINGQNIPIVPTHKYLGMTLDSKLSFGSHIDDIRSRCLRRLNILRCISGQNWGADRKTLLNLYTSLIRSILEYNAFLFDNISETRKASLEAVQNEAVRIITGAFRTSPTCSLLAEVNLPSLAHRRYLQVTKYSIRVNAIHNHPSLQILTNVPQIPDHEYNRNKYTIAKNLWDIKDFALGLPDIPISYTPKPSAFWNMKSINVDYLIKTPKQSLSPFEIQSRFAEYRHLHEQHFFLYTDGSRTEKGTGLGIVGNGIAKSIRLSDYNSIYTAELIAIREAYKYLLDSKYTRAIICTDSLSSVNVLETLHNSSHPVVNEIRHLNHRIPTNSAIKILWIPGHMGITGNEKADFYAKQSLNLPANNELPCPASDIISYAHQRFQTYRQRIWERQGKHLNRIKPQLRYWNSCHQNHRKKERILARLRIGHTSLTHQYIFDRMYGRTAPPTCHVCGDLFTIEHFLLQCPIHNLHRRPIMDYFLRKQLHPTLPVLLGDEHPELLELLFTFLHKTRLELFV